ncbi:helicase HerA domain-containing protein [Gordonia sp. NPDC058843]|uniref:helicase HerA domain-containing protein n=1 Tax=Gordonia sp. NPDC058843 TaxID=3346648 RepID=UPI0036930998
MEADARQALESIRLNWADTPDDVWGTADPFHVGGLHEDTIVDIVRSFDDARRSPSGSPIGVTVRGPAGSGKTHLLGRVRYRIQDEGGYFFLVKLLDATDFWRSVLVAIIEDLGRPTPRHRSQLNQLLHRLAIDAEVSDETRAAVTGGAQLTPAALDDFIRGVYTRHSRHRRRSQHILRALVLLESDDFTAKDLGEAFLHLDIDDADELAAWGIRNARLGYQEIVENISRIIAFDDAAVLAIDQIDTLIEAGKTAEAGEESQVEKLAHGLMSVRETMSRTTCVVSSISAAWEYLAGHVMRSAVDRFRLPPTLQRPASADFGRLLLARRFAPGFAGVGFTPPHPTWPVTDTALTTATDYTPRELMVTVDRQIAAMLRSDTFVEITDLSGTAPASSARRATVTTTADGQTTLPGFDESVSDTEVPAVDSPPVRTSSSTPGSSERSAFGNIDQRYAELISRADPLPALVPDTEDRIVPSLLHAGLATWIQALSQDADRWQLDARPGPKSPLHGRIRQLVDPNRDIEQSWSFRAIAASNARAVQTRLSSATTSSGFTLGDVERTLVILRRDPWPTGPKTRQMVTELHDRGGRVVAWTERDIKRLSALAALRAERPSRLREWISARNPAAEIGFITEILGPALEVPAAQAPAPQTPASHSNPIPAQTESATADETSTSTAFREAESRGHRSPAPRSEAASPNTAESHARTTTPDVGESITLGRSVATGEAVTVSLLALRKHVALFAGSGSGKTVLIRRLVEEAALQGVSSIVLDVNNDLARLGTPWPDTDPRPWTPEDRERAKRYLQDTEVAVFTPGRASGRPLSFQPLPDFTTVAGNPDEFRAAVDSAVGALIPHARATGTSAKAYRQQAVLQQSMEAFGRRGGGSLQAYVGLLTELPSDASTLADAGRLGAELAENLKASMAIDPVFGGDAAPADPGFLLTPTAGFRARVSIVNLAGLGTDDRRAGFVNQLQMALFAWIKKNPAADRPLGGLLVMDEAQNFAPSVRMTAASKSTSALASQARKYGLGLIFATQSPTGIDNKISANSSTQIFGLLNHPTQIDRAKELAANKGSRIPDIGKLPAGTFYIASEGGRFTRAETPLCLTYHPSSPPTEDEVLELARSTTPRTR